MKKHTALLILAGLMIRCTHDPVIPAEPDVSFSQQVLPIIVSNCATDGCHNGSSSGEEDLYPLMTYHDVLRFVKAGDAHASKLYKNITTLSGENAMPPDRPLTEEQIRIIYSWIMQGAKNN